ncbi:MAG: SAM-dependent chlorinase/fluorinase [Gammaproteobacteria bacterium]|nr:SAM-dependent chlorinase/fluorinase [Gammaproteobacteria bacterium]
MKVSGVITITTDFGHKGPFAAVMRGVILTRNPDAHVIDLAHDIPPHWPPEAGFWISRSYKYFPRGTIHMAIVDPGVGTERDILLVEHDDHIFIAPDNGLLGPLLDSSDQSRVWTLDTERLGSLQLAQPSETFHGRDIFAPVAAELAAGRLSLSQAGNPAKDWTPGWVDEPDVAGKRVAGIIITIDAFGNLISNIDESLIAGFDEPVASIAGHEIPMLSSYGRAKPGQLLALKNSFGVVEVAKAEGSAAEGLGLERGAPLVISNGYTT